MNKNNKTRLIAISGATLALVVASTAAVSAHPGGGDGRGQGFGSRAGAKASGQDFGGMRGKARARTNGQGFAGLRGMKDQLRAGMADRVRGQIDDFERRETTLQTADGTTVMRVEHGVLDSASDSAVTFTVGDEIVTVTIDDDTTAVAFSEQEVETRRGLSRTRVVPAEVAVADLEVGTDVVIWSDAEDGGDFVASRIVVHPAMDEATEDATEEAADVETATDESAALPLLDA